jgi:lysozyme family protein
MTVVDYDRILDFIIRMEGGYVNDPVDPGGETKYGISKRSYPELDIKNLSPEQAKTIYKRDYYDKIVSEGMTFSQATFLTDTAVNNGTGTARRFWSESNGDVDKMFALRKQRYLDIIARKPSQIKYKNGWMNRLEHLRKFIQ